MSTDIQDSINGLLSAVSSTFKDNVKAALLAQYKEQMAGELEKIAEQEAKRITDVLVHYHKDIRDWSQTLHLRLTINGTEVTNDSN